MMRWTWLAIAALVACGAEQDHAPQDSDVDAASPPHVLDASLPPLHGAPVMGEDAGARDAESTQDEMCVMGLFVKL